MSTLIKTKTFLFNVLNFCQTLIDEMISLEEFLTDLASCGEFRAPPAVTLSPHISRNWSSSAVFFR